MKAPSKRANSILVIDIGGTHVKVLATRQREEREIPSGSHMTARKMVRDVKRVTKDWDYGLVSIGYPGPVIHGRPLHEPHNLGGGWVGFVPAHKGIAVDLCSSARPDADRVCPARPAR